MNATSLCNICSFTVSPASISYNRSKLLKSFGLPSCLITQASIRPD
jgi:phosphatidylserine synthase